MPEHMKSKKILFIASSHDKMGDTISKTGVWLEELSAPYYVFREAGIAVTIASPNGGAIPLEPKSQSTILATQSTKRFLKDAEAMAFLAGATPLTAINTDDFDAVYLPGGHGALWDLAGDQKVKAILESFNKQDRPIGAVSQGVISLLELQDATGQLLISGRNLTCFSNAEEASAGLLDILPFLLETRLQAVGALFTKGPLYVSHVMADGNIITGQNPASAEAVARNMILFLKAVDWKSSSQSVTKVA